MTYTVYVGDNFRYMAGKGDDLGYKKGEYDSWEEAVAVAKGIVDEFLEDSLNDFDSPEKLIESYKLYGEDPYIIPNSRNFSAWDYAEKKCRRLFK